MIEEPTGKETDRAVSVDIAGIQRLLELSTAALREKGLARGPYSLERTSAIYLLALSILNARDRDTAIPHFLETALPLLASSQAEQDVLYRRYRQNDRPAILRGIFRAKGEPEAPERTPPTLERPAPAALPLAANARGGEVPASGAAAPSRWGRIRGLRQRLSLNRAVKLLRKPVPLLAESYALSLPAIRVAKLNMRESARNASLRLPIQTKKLHIPKTVLATVQKAGYFTPVWRTRLETNEYLFLVRQLSRCDFEYQRMRALILELRDQGVLLNLYSYNDDPRVLCDVLSAEEADYVRLEQLRERHPDSRLILVSEGHELLDRLTYAPLPVAGELTLWPRRALLTPLPSADWGSIEGVIHHDLGFSIASSRENGLGQLGQLFSGMSLEPVALHSIDLRAVITPGFVASPSLRYVDDAEPSREEQDRLVFELRMYLEASGFLWLGACAFFPAATPAIAKFFARELGIADPGGKIFARLCVLPWMRFGHMPRWLRRRLEQSLEETGRGRAQRAAASLLASENLAGKEGAGLPAAYEFAPGGDSLILPVRIGHGAEGEAELDDLTVELLAAGASEEIDPIFKVSPALHASLRKARAFKDGRQIPGASSPGFPQKKTKTHKRATASDPGLHFPSAAPQTDTSDDFKERYIELLALNVSFIAYLSQGAKGEPHFKIFSLNVSHVIEPDGSSTVSRSYVASFHKATHPFLIWVEADAESDPVSGLRPLDIQIIDKRTGQNLAWLVLENEPRKKTFAIIFANPEGREQEEFEFRYRWPGFMKRVLEKGSTDFYWRYRTASPDSRVDVTYDWLFLKGFPKVTLLLKGDHGGASLNYREHSEGQRWTYHDPAAIVEGQTYTVSVKRV
jgi:hypothetical protein